MAGLGTGTLAEWLPKIVDHGGMFGVSGMSSQARYDDERRLNGRLAVVAMPDTRVDLVTAADMVQCD